MRKLILLLIFCLSLNQASAQLLDNLRLGLESNMAWYNDDKRTGAFFDEENNDGDEHVRVNSYLKLDYDFLKNFTATVQIESYEPLALLNYSPNFEGTNFGIYSLNYKSNKLEASAGHYYEQFGSGMILRNWEDRQLGLNNALLGGRMKYMPLDFLALTALYGKQRVGFETADSDIFGFNTELDLSNIFNFENSSLNLGFSYVGRNETADSEDPNFDDLTNAFSGRIDFTEGNFYANAEYVTKTDDVAVIAGQLIDNFVNPGNALLLNTGFSQKGFGIDATFRRLENMGFYSEREKTGNVFLENNINFTPALTKQHDYLLTNIFVYQAQSQVVFADPQLMEAGEIGGQVDLFYNIKKGTSLGGKYGTKLAFNASYWAGLKGDYDYNNLSYDVDYFGFGEKYFSDISLEIRKKWNKKVNSIFYYVNQYYNQRTIEDNFSGEQIKTNIVVGETIYKFGRIGQSVRLEFQKLWSNSDNHDWIGGTFEYNVSPRLSFYVNDIYNSGMDSSTSENHYYNFGGSYNKGTTRFSLNYGRQRAGLVCVGGVCRFVPEATGLSASLLMSF
ncbi:DUF6029 family protein [Winogradskyella vincentii]|uniref:DUF6029 family protein n=1 Tax=Winogradskyella vincentii TaxID=2877122 RepID=A0ABS7XW18_9FLAO|nr:DUF6029 family protein [Winogradskyella vincentii]MCA0151841.1 DUF6029 family protein [Winogradskyella vincentii]